MAAEIIGQVTKDMDDKEIAHKLDSNQLLIVAHLDYRSSSRIPIKLSCLPRFQLRSHKASRVDSPAGEATRVR